MFGIWNSRDWHILGVDSVALRVLDSDQEPWYSTPMKTTVIDLNCQKNPDLFFSDNEVAKSQAIAICSSCPVKDACLLRAEGNSERYGVWGGKDFSSNSSPKKPKLYGGTGLCKNGLHTKTKPGLCEPCREATKKRSYRTYYANLKKTGRIEEVLKKSRDHRKAKIGGKCRSGRHVLTDKNTMIRGYDGALMCAECYKRVQPIVLSQEARKKARGYN